MTNWHEFNFSNQSEKLREKRTIHSIWHSLEHFIPCHAFYNKIKSFQHSKMKRKMFQCRYDIIDVINNCEFIFFLILIQSGLHSIVSCWCWCWILISFSSSFIISDFSCWKLKHLIKSFIILVVLLFYIQTVCKCLKFDGMSRGIEHWAHRRCFGSVNFNLMTT